MLKLKNKRNFFSILLFSITCLFNSNVFADQKSFSINNAYTNFPNSNLNGLKEHQSFKSTKNHLQGINLQYLYEWNDPLSFMSSVTFSFDKKISNDKQLYIQDKNFYKSFLVGPAYKLNNFLSFYAIAGLSHTKQILKIIDHESSDTFTNKSLLNNKTINNKNSFSYGIGIIINPLKTLSINLGYEGTRLNVGKYDGKINQFIFGVGYNF